MESVKKEFNRLLQAIAVKRNLNELKKFAYANGYQNKVTEYKNEILAEIREAGITGEACIKHLTDHYTGGKMLSTAKTSSIDDLFSEE